MEREALGPFFLARRLGAGGMGEVYLAHGPIPGGTGVSVIKVLRKGLEAHEQVVRRFEDEARVAAALDHPNIAVLYDAGYIDDVPFMSLEYISGITLKELMALGRVPDHVAVHVVTSLLSALAAAHDAKGADGRPLRVVHRDVSPQNVMIDLEGVVKLIDFGVAHYARKSVQTNAGQFIGKMKYAPPEQLLGDDVDARADVFAAGVVITELFTGQRFYEKLSDDQAVGAALDEGWSSPALMALRPQLRRVLERSTAREREARYPSAGAFERAVIEALGTLPNNGGPAQMRAFLGSTFADEIERLGHVRAEALLSAKQYASRASTREATMISVISVTPPSSIGTDPTVVRKAPVESTTSNDATAVPATVTIPPPDLLPTVPSRAPARLAPPRRGRIAALAAAVATVAVVAVVVARHAPDTDAPTTTATPPNAASSTAATATTTATPTPPLSTTTAPSTTAPSTTTTPTTTTTTAPSTTAPSTTAPSTTAPSTTAPSTTAPSTTAPSTTAPSTTAPSTTAPSTTAPSTTAPSATAPSTTTTTMPTTAPSTTAPSTTAPSTTAPSTTAPSATAPSATAPSTTAPSATAPSTTAPSATARSTTAPSTTAPSTTASSTTTAPSTTATATGAKSRGAGHAKAGHARTTRPSEDGAGALERMLKRAHEACSAIAECAALPQAVDPNAMPLDDLLALRQRTRACIDACGR